MDFIEIIKNALEIDGFDYIQLLYMCIRATIIYFIGIGIARSNKKIIGIRTPFNFMLFVMLGAIFANAIIKSVLFLPIAGTILFLIVLNFIIKLLVFHFRWFESFVKGSSVSLVEDGKINWKQMNAHLITERELLNKLASQSHHSDIKKVKEAVFASDGSINFIFK